jgi:hypothetical protein
MVNPRVSSSIIINKQDIIQEAVFILRIIVNAVMCFNLKKGSEMDIKILEEIMVKNSFVIRAIPLKIIDIYKPASIKNYPNGVIY